MAEQSQTRSDDQASEAGSRGLLPPQQRSPFGWVALALAVMALAAGGWWYQRSQVSRRPPRCRRCRCRRSPSLSRPHPAPAAAASVAPLAEPKVAEGPLDEAGVGAALAALAGPQAARSLLVTDDFVRRFVVTIDNLGREHAPPRLWPVPPTPGRFQVIERDGRSYVNPDNAARYTPWVLLAEQIDPSRRGGALRPHAAAAAGRPTRNSATRASASTPG